MKTIPEIQAGLRNAAEALTTQVLELTRELSDLQAQQVQASTRTMPNFARLSRDGRRQPIRGHPIGKLRETDQVSYLAALCALAQETPQADEAWLLLQRVASGLGMSTLEQPLGVALRMGERELEVLAATVEREDLVSVFLLDAMLVRLCCGETCPRTVELLEDLTLLMNPSESKLYFLTSLASVLARQDGAAFLDLWRRQGTGDCPGGCYLQKRSGVLYTSDPKAAQAHSYRRVILHDCILKCKMGDDQLVLEQCILLNCTIDLGVQGVTFCNSLLVNCTFKRENLGAMMDTFSSLLVGRTRGKTTFKTSVLSDCVLEYRKPAGSTYSYGLDDFCKFDDTPKEGITYREI